jgi:elongation factor P hydroxylase
MSENSRAPQGTEHSIDVGYWMAVVLPKDTAPLRCYVGQVQAVDEQGVRLTLMDWITGTASNYDFFVAWRNLESALIATPEHSRHDFEQQARQWQEAMMKHAHSPQDAV